MEEAGWEIAAHGLKWIDYKDVPRGTERQHLHRAVAIHKEVTGAAPLGFYLGRSSMNTVDLVIEHGGFLWCSDSYADDLPYWVGPQLIIPYTLDANDTRFATGQGFNSGEQFFT
jgi:peptidoglycan/xylan/chitin deacetylase (PgdA/CDA1 family)